jgi:predicted enzyme related to lactoylglutathione lyase
LDEHNPPKTAHFCLVVDDFQSAVDRLRESGCHVEQAMPIPGRHRFYTRDPAGNRIEIMSYDGEDAS